MTLTHEELIERLYVLEAEMPRDTLQDKRRLSAFHVMISRLEIL